MRLICRWIISGMLITGLSGCHIGKEPYKHGNEHLLKWDEARLRQTFPVGSTMLDQLEEVMGSCDYKRLSDDEMASKEMMEQGMSMVCSYRYVSGYLSNCSDDSCYVGSGQNEFKEISAEFTFDSSGLLAGMAYHIKTNIPSELKKLEKKKINSN